MKAGSLGGTRADVDRAQGTGTARVAWRRALCLAEVPPGVSLDERRAPVRARPPSLRLAPKRERCHRARRVGRQAQPLLLGVGGTQGARAHRRGTRRPQAREHDAAVEWRRPRRTRRASGGRRSGATGCAKRRSPTTASTRLRGSWEAPSASPSPRWPRSTTRSWRRRAARCAASARALRSARRRSTCSSCATSWSRCSSRATSRSASARAVSLATTLATSRW